MLISFIIFRVYGNVENEDDAMGFVGKLLLGGLNSRGIKTDPLSRWAPINMRKVIDKVKKSKFLVSCRLVQ